MPTTHNKRRKSKSPSKAVAGKIAVVTMGNINTPITKKSRNDADDLSFTSSKSSDDESISKSNNIAKQQQHHHHHVVVDRNKDECDICGERGGE